MHSTILCFTAKTQISGAFGGKLRFLPDGMRGIYHIYARDHSDDIRRRLVHGRDLEGMRQQG